MRLSHVHTDNKAEPYENPVINQARRQEKTQNTRGKSESKKAKQPEKPFADIYSQYRSKAIRTSEQWKSKEASGNSKLTIVVSIVVIVLGLVITLVDNLGKPEKTPEWTGSTSSSYEEYELQEEQEAVSYTHLNLIVPVVFHTGPDGVFKNFIKTTGKN